MDRRFNKFPASVNAVLQTTQKLCTHHYVCLHDLPRESLQHFTHHSNRDAHHYVRTDVLYD